MRNKYDKETNYTFNNSDLQSKHLTFDIKQEVDIKELHVSTVSIIFRTVLKRFLKISQTV